MAVVGDLDYLQSVISWDILQEMEVMDSGN